MLDGFFFFEFLTPFTLQGHNFFIYNPFLDDYKYLKCAKEGIQIWFGHQKQQSPPLGSGLP
jgi:hypothetical protein